MLKFLLSYIAHLQSTNALVDASDQFQITIDGYDGYRISPLYLNRRGSFLSAHFGTFIPFAPTPVPMLVPMENPTSTPF